MSKWLKLLIVILFLVAIGIGGYKGILRNKAVKEANSKAVVSFADMNASTLTSYNLAKADKVKNVLLVGSDKRGKETGYGRSDCMIIATIDQKDSQLKMTSLLGDSYVEIPGYGKNKLSMAYSIGGISLLYETIASNFGIQLDNYAIVEFNSFVNIIDKVGGITLPINDKEAQYMQTHYTNAANQVASGENMINGTQALAYVRIKQDGARDFGRVERQRKVLKALCSTMTDTSVSQLVPVVNEILKTVSTDINEEEARDYLASVIALSTGSLLEKTIPANDAYIAKVKKGSTIYELDLEKCKATIADFVYNPVEMQDTQAVESTDTK